MSDPDDEVVDEAAAFAEGPPEDAALSSIAHWGAREDWSDWNDPAD